MMAPIQVSEYTFETLGTLLEFEFRYSRLLDRGGVCYSTDIFFGLTTFIIRYVTNG